MVFFYGLWSATAVAQASLKVIEMCKYFFVWFQVPYVQYFFGKIIDENSIQKECKIKYFVRKLDMPSMLSVPKMKEILIKDKAIKIYTLGSAQIGVMSAKEYFASLFNALKNDNSIFLRNS